MIINILSIADVSIAAIQLLDVKKATLLTYLAAAPSGPVVVFRSVERAR